MIFFHKRRDFLGAVAAIAALWCVSAAPSRAQEATERLEFVTRTGVHNYVVEVMRTSEQWQKGLMHRRSLPQNSGMLFLFNREAPVSMWMKNTYIPLDMVFLAKDGHVLSIAQEAEPMSERRIEASGPVWAVVELNAGATERMELRPGDQARHAAFINK